MLPHTQVIGDTFEFTFILPKPANSGGGRPKARHATNPTRKVRKSTSGRETISKANRPHLTEEQKRELRRVRAAEERQRRKELGLCKDCPSKTINDRTRCNDTLAERFFNPDMAGRNVYLYVNQDMIDEMEQAMPEAGTFCVAIAGPPTNAFYYAQVCQRAWDAFTGWREKRYTVWGR